MSLRDLAANGPNHPPVVAPDGVMVFDLNSGNAIGAYDMPLALVELAPEMAVLLADMADALDEVAGFAHPVSGSDHDFLYDDVPALLARFRALEERA